MSLISNFPQPLLDKLVATVLRLSPSLQITFLADLGTRIHASTVRATFSSLSIPDDDVLLCEHGRFTKSMVHSLFSNPGRYASIVKSLVIRDPKTACERIPDGTTMCNDTNDLLYDPQGSRVICPIASTSLASLLKICCNLEEFIWEGTLPPPDGVCELLVKHNPRLTIFAHIPHGQQSSLRPSNAAKWGIPSLPLLCNVPMTALHLSRLSQTGARALSTFLSSLGEDFLLESLTVDFIWLDDQLCEKIAETGRKLRSLRIGTSGTKLSDNGIIALVEGCDALEELVLDEVQGRLSRSLWTKPNSFPPNLRLLRIVVSETGHQHSWTTDHLQSLDAIPVETLTELSLVRKEAIPYLYNGVPVRNTVVEEAVALRPPPTDFVKRVADAKNLTKFECDFWKCSIADIKLILENCNKLEVLKFCLDAPFAKLLGLTSAFAPLSHLHTLLVSVNPDHAPGNPPAPLLPQSSQSLPTPADSPVLKSKAVLPQLLDFDQMQTQTYVTNLSVGDPSMPLLRDIKRFVRKCPRLERLVWYGKAGRGSWIVSRPATTVSKISINVTVQYLPPRITNEVWEAMLAEEELGGSRPRGWVWADAERAGQAWDDDQATAAAHGFGLADKDKGRVKDVAKRDKLPTIATQFSTPSAIIPLTPRKQSHSPSSKSSLPTPPHSDSSSSGSAASGSPEQEFRDNRFDAYVANRKRSPSEPTIRFNDTVIGRDRSSTTSTKSPSMAQNSRSCKNTAVDIVSNTAKYGRGRGRGNRKGASAYGDDNADFSSSGHSGTGRGLPRTSGFTTGRAKKAGW